jgi:twinkle protein
MDFHEVKQFLNGMASDVVRTLLPNGRRSGKEWLTGNIDGDKGDSLSVCLSGPRLGLWLDRATGTDKGDLIDLWMVTRGFKTKKDTIQDIHKYYGLKNSEFDSFGTKTYQVPQKPENKKSNDVVKYLTEVRKLTVETLKAFDVSSDGEYYYLPFYRDGELLNWKKVSIKRDPQKPKKKKIFGADQARPILFGWQALDPKYTEIIITEGEIDAMTLHQWGYPALSVPNGVSSLDWIQQEYDNLNYFEHIYICMDNDPAGQNKIEEIVSRLGRHRCSAIILPKNDANECLMSGLSSEVIADAINDHKEFKPHKIQSIEYFADLVHAKTEGKLEDKGQPLPFGSNNSFRFNPGEMTVWQGYNGHGKSMVLSQTIIDLVINRDQIVCLASMEMKPEDLVIRLLKQISGMEEQSRNYKNHILNQLKEKVFIYNHLGDEQMEDILEAFVFCRRKYGASHFMIDSLMKCALRKDDYDGQKNLMKKAVDFVQQYKGHLHLVAHSKKPTGNNGEYNMPGKFDVEGASEISNFTDNLICVWRNKKKEKDLREAQTDLERATISSLSDAVINVQKNRHGSFEEEILLWYNVPSQQYITSNKQPPKRFINYSEVF